jgi:hypothetical protein
VFLRVLFNIVVYIVHFPLDVIYNKDYCRLTNTYNVFKEERPHYAIKLYKGVLGTMRLY